MILKRQWTQSRKLFGRVLFVFEKFLEFDHAQLCIFSRFEIDFRLSSICLLKRRKFIFFNCQNANGAKKLLKFLLSKENLVFKINWQNFFYIDAVFAINN